MPRKARQGKKYRKRVPRRVRRRNTVNVNRALSPIPQRYITKMKYANTVLTDANGNFILNLNSLVAPQQTTMTGGHQPYGFDQLAGLYNRYRVIACGWRVQAANATSVTQFACMPGNSLSTFTPANFSLLKETSRAKYVTQMPGGNAQTISGKSYLPSLAGRSKSEYMADDRYQSDVLSSPAEALELLIKTVSVIDAPIAGFGVNILLEYTVEFFDIKQLTQS